MFIRRKEFYKLVEIIDGMKDEIGVLRREIEDEANIRRLERGAFDRRLDKLGNERFTELERLHRGLEQRVSEAESKSLAQEHRLDALEEKTSLLDEFAETEEADRKAERSFLQGIQNIMNFRG